MKPNNEGENLLLHNTISKTSCVIFRRCNNIKKTADGHLRSKETGTDVSALRDLTQNVLKPHLYCEMAVHTPQYIAFIEKCKVLGFVTVRARA
jgi:hypothetical protein